MMNKSYQNNVNIQKQGDANFKVGLEKYITTEQWL